MTREDRDRKIAEIAKVAPLTAHYLTGDHEVCAPAYIVDNRCSRCGLRSCAEAQRLIIYWHQPCGIGCKECRP